MEVLLFLIGLLLTLLLILVLLAAIFAFVGWQFEEIRTFLFPYRYKYLPLSNRYKRHIEEHFAYYSLLGQDEKKEFEKRVQRFISQKKFVSRGGLERVEDSLKALIASTAVQLTFGFRDIQFEHFKRILIYPNSYYSTIRKQQHNGEVHPSGIIVLSARHFLRGLIIKDDGRNLGLHELAHALYLENKIENSEFNFLNSSTLIQFSDLGKYEISKIKNGEKTIFRSYGGENLFEFFSVCIELFFERPDMLYDYNRLLYEVIARLLNQDPQRMRVKESD